MSRAASIRRLRSLLLLLVISSAACVGSARPIDLPKPPFVLAAVPASPV